jgi:hypothetical protein
MDALESTRLNELRLLQLQEQQRLAEQKVLLYISVVPRIDFAFVFQIMHSHTKSQATSLDATISPIVHVYVANRMRLPVALLHQEIVPAPPPLPPLPPLPL